MEYSKKAQTWCGNIDAFQWAVIIVCFWKIHQDLKRMSRAQDRMKSNRDQTSKRRRGIQSFMGKTLDGNQVMLTITMGTIGWNEGQGI
jgi:hypothetical protein